MTTFPIHCPTCGPRSMTLAEIKLTLDHPAAAPYGLRCPSCRGWLSQIGTRPALNLDDLIEFHFLLASDDWFDDLLVLEAARSLQDVSARGGGRSSFP